MRSASRSGAKKSLRTIPIIIIVTIILASISGATAAVISYGDSIWPALEGSVFSTIGSNGTSTAPKGRSTSTKARFAKIRAGAGFLEASVTTDQQDYAPGQVVNISGSGFAPGESVSLQVTYVTVAAAKATTASASFDASGHDPWFVTADGDGNITSSWLVENDSLNQALLLTATGQSSGLTATHQFSDSLVGDFDQCANNAGGGLPLGRCGWINGIIQQSNSKYFEGMSTLQRLIFPSLSGSSHSLSFHDDFTKAGLHAYDFLTSWEQGIKAGADNGVPYSITETYVPVSGEASSINKRLTNASACAAAISGTDGPICTAIEGNLPNHFDVLVPDDAFLSHDGSTASKIAAYESVYGERYVRIYGNAPITAANFGTPTHDVANGGDTGDSITTYTLNWTSTSTEIIVEWGEHIASGDDGFVPLGGWGHLKGASSISGGPYHVSLDQIDTNSLGSLDNQLKGADVLPPPAANLIIKKVVVNDNGGTATANSFGITTSAGSFTFGAPTGSAPTLTYTSSTITNIQPGTYTLHENTLAGYTEGTWSCSGGTGAVNGDPQNGSVTLNNAENVTCTITNNDTPPSLKLIKHVINDNGGTATANAWTLHAGANQVTGSETAVEVTNQAGTYALSETGGATGYTQTSLTCDDAPSTQVTSVTIGNGQTKTCTFVNNDNAPSLKLIKHVINDNGGTATANAWTLHAGANAVTGSETAVEATNQAGTYALSETGGPSGYTQTSLTCDDAPSTQVTSVTVGLGQTKTCTFVNNDNAPSLKLIKHVINDNGGAATANAWTLNAGANAVTGSETAVQATNQAGTYALSETGGPAHYTQTSLTCDNNAGVQVTSVTLGLGQTITCTFVNNDDAPSLKLIKHVINDNGGAATANAWTLNAGANAVTGSETAVQATNQAGTYALSETGGPAHYTQTSLTCDDAPNTQVTSVTIGLGQTKTCTFVNNDDAPSLKLIKHVINDNGGTATANAWTLHAGANQVTGSESAVQATNQAGTYALSETGGPSGYTQTSLTCDDAPSTQVTSVTVGLGQTKTCTFVNNDNAPSLKLIKHVINDNGGTALANAWTLHAGAFFVAGSETAVQATDQAGTYALSETGGPSGYTQTSLTCDDAPSTQVTSVTVGLGQTKTCTFVNNDNAPSLKLIKHVINDNGGTALANAWTLHAGANAVTGSESAVEATNQAGTYALSETGGPSGYTQTSLTCDDAPSTQVTSVTVGLGQTKTCTFVNNDNAPSLKLIKHVVNDNGGTALANAWTLHAGAFFVAGSESAVQATDQAGTYALSETGGPAHYTQTSLTCDDAPSTQVTSVTIGLGQTKTCTFVNNDDAPALKLIKHVINDNGGTALANAWTLNAGASSVAGSESAVLVTSQAGTYALSETGGPSGYTQTSLTCDDAPSTQVTSVTIGLGQTKTCTFVNNDNAPSLKLIKHVVNDNGGTALANAWKLNAGANQVTGSETAVEATNQAGTYALSETGGATGYTQTSLTCDDAPSTQVTSVTVGLGQTKTCTFVNNDNAPSLKLIKHVINNNGGLATANAWTLNAGANQVTGSETAVQATNQAGTYALSETGGATGYTQTSLTCDDAPSTQVTSVTIGLGQTKTCTFVNDDIPPSLKLIKHVINDNGGTATANAWKLNAGANQVTGSETAVEATNQAGTYALSETGGPSGYTQTSLTCDDAPSTQVTSVSIGLGQTKTCTFVNDDNPGKIVIIKNAKPASGTFTFDTTGTTSGPGTSWPTGLAAFTLTGSTSGGGNTQTFNVDAGNYSATEEGQNGWTLTGIGGGNNPNQPYACASSGNGSSGLGDINTGTVTIHILAGDTVTCTYENTGNLTTRTQGFWATHPQLANLAWFGGTGFGHTFPGVAATGLGDRSIGNCRLIDDLPTLMGGFWSSIAKKTTNGKRESLDQARMQLLQQLLAAELNYSAFGSTPAGGFATIQSWENAYCGTAQNAINKAQQAAAAFNESGDSGTFTPGTSADAKTARSIANYQTWDLLP